MTTPFERAQERIKQTAATLRTLTAVQRIIQDMDDVEIGMSMLDWNDPEERPVFLEALKDKRKLDKALIMCSNLMEEHFGIRA